MANCSLAKELQFASSITSDQPQSSPVSRTSNFDFSDLDEAEVCRICYEPATPQDPLISPCACRGSVGFIHTTCISDVIVRTRRTQCDLCLHQYRLRWKTKSFRQIKWIPEENMFTCCPNRCAIVFIVGIFVFLLTTLAGIIAWNSITKHKYDVDHWGFSAIILIPTFLTWQYFIVIYISRVLLCLENSVLSPTSKSETNVLEVSNSDQISYGTFA